LLRETECGGLQARKVGSTPIPAWTNRARKAGVQNTPADPFVEMLKMKYLGKFDRRKLENEHTTMLVDAGIRYSKAFGEKFALCYWAAHGLTAALAERVSYDYYARRVRVAQEITSSLESNV
jgi:hypothetical protein